MNQVSYRFQDKVAFVTGASSGIGKATALAFAAAGARVAVCDLNEDQGRGLVASLREKGQAALFVKCDVSRSTDVKAAVEETVRQFGRLDFAFNNAGVEGSSGLIPDCSEESFDRTIAINLKGIWLCMKYQIPHMLKNGGGAIVNCSSIAGLVGFAGAAAYTASKHGVIGLTKAAALENAKSKIRVNAVCPGVIQTPMIDRFTHGEAQIRQQLAAGEPVGRIGTPEEIAGSVLWLCSDQSSFVTGDALVVDGGWVAQ